MEPSNVPPECKTEGKKSQVPEVSGEGTAIGCEKQEHCIRSISQNADRPEECDKLLQPERIQSRHAPEFICLIDSIIRNPENINLTAWEGPNSADDCSLSLYYNIDNTPEEVFQPQNTCKNGGKESEQAVDIQQPELQKSCVSTSKQDIDAQPPKLLDSCDISKEDMNVLQPMLQESFVPVRNQDIHIQQPMLQDSCDISKKDSNVLQTKLQESIVPVRNQDIHDQQPELQESCVSTSKQDIDAQQPKLLDSCDISKKDTNVLQPELQESFVPVRNQDIHVQQPMLQDSCDISKEDTNELQPKLQDNCAAVSKEELETVHSNVQEILKEDMDVIQPKLQENCVAVSTQKEEVQSLILHVNCVADSKKDEDVLQQNLQENYIKKFRINYSDQAEIRNEIMYLRGPDGNHKFTSGTQCVLCEQQSSGHVADNDHDLNLTTNLNSESQTSLHSEKPSTTARNLPVAAIASVPVASFTAKNSLSMCDVIYGSDSDSGKSRESRESIFIPEYAHDVNIVSSGAGSLKTLISSESLGARNADSTVEHEIKAAAVGEKDRPLVNSRSDEMWSAGINPFWSSTDVVTGHEAKLERWNRTTNLEMDEMCDHFMRCDCLLEAHGSRKNVMACPTGTIHEFYGTNGVFKSETGNNLKHLVNELIKPASNSELESDFKKADKRLGVEYEGDECKKNIELENTVHCSVLNDKYMPRVYNEHSNNYIKCGDKKDFKMASFYSSHPSKNLCSEDEMLRDLNQHKMQSVFFQRPKHGIKPGYCCRHGNPYTGRQYNGHNVYDNPRLGGGTMCKLTNDSLEDEELWQVRNEADCQLNMGIVIEIGCDRNKTNDAPTPEVKLTNKRPRDPSGESPEQKRSYLSNIGLITTKKPKVSLYLGPEESEDEEDGDGDLMRAQQVMVEIILAGESPVASNTDIRVQSIEPPARINEEQFHPPESCSMALGPSCSLEAHVVSEVGTLPKKKKKVNWFVNQFSRLMHYLFRKD